jgi:hypothetical protein
MLSHGHSQLELASSYAHMQFIRIGYTGTAFPVNFFAIRLIFLGQNFVLGDNMTRSKYGEEGKTEWFVADRDTVFQDMPLCLTCLLSITKASERPDTLDFICNRSLGALCGHGQV